MVKFCVFFLIRSHERKRQKTILTDAAGGGVAPLPDGLAHVVGAAHETEPTVAAVCHDGVNGMHRCLGGHGAIHWLPRVRALYHYNTRSNIIEW